MGRAGRWRGAGLTAASDLRKAEWDMRLSDITEKSADWSGIYAPTGFTLAQGFVRWKTPVCFGRCGMIWG